MKIINPIGIYNNIIQIGIKRPYNNCIINKKNKKNNKKNKKNNNKYNDNSKDLYQESISYLSTTSGGDYNNYNKVKNFIEEKQNNKNENLLESIKKGIKDIQNYFDSNKNNSISLACYYYCNININEQQKNNLEKKNSKIN